MKLSCMRNAESGISGKVYLKVLNSSIRPPSSEPVLQVADLDERHDTQQANIDESPQILPVTTNHSLEVLFAFVATVASDTKCERSTQ